jgi:hypothetical protein
MLRASRAANGDNGVALRHQSSTDQYYMVYNSGGGAFQVYLRNGGYTLLDTLSASAGLAVGDVIRGEIDGNTIVGKVNGVPIGSPVSAGGTLSGGQPGIVLFNAFRGLDNWNAGDLQKIRNPYLNSGHRPYPFRPGIAR